MQQENLLFKDWIAYHKKEIFESRWVTVFERKKGNEDIHVYCALVRKEIVKHRLDLSGWDLCLPGCPASETESYKNGKTSYGYESYAHGADVQPFIYMRSIKEENLYYPEICEEFRKTIEISRY